MLEILLSDLELTQKEAQICFNEGSWKTANNLYQQLATLEPDCPTHQWYIGLCHLFQYQIETAQTVWKEALIQHLSQGDTLLQTLRQEAERYRLNKNHQGAWIIEDQLYQMQKFLWEQRGNPEILPLQDLLQQLLTSEDSADWNGLTPLLSRIFHYLETESPVELELLYQSLQKLCQNACLFPTTYQFAKLSLPYIENLDHLDSKEEWSKLYFTTSISIAQTWKSGLVIEWAELALKITPDKLDILKHLQQTFSSIGQFSKGAEVAKTLISKTDNPVELILTYHELLSCLLMSGGYWDEVFPLQHEQTLLLENLQEDILENHDFSSLARIFVTLFHHTYINDNPKHFQQLQQHTAILFQKKLESLYPELVEKYKCNNQNRLKNRDKQTLKVGYVCTCFRSHSVGYLARALLSHHNPEKVEVYLYMVNYSLNPQDYLQQWYLQNFKNIRPILPQENGEKTGLKIAETVDRDNIDILIDLDSLTSALTCMVFALKPAPIQVSWLGWDSSSLPTMDYMLVDHHVLPPSAETYYHEKLWRLPKTYLAIDGFEVDLPTLTREDLEIADDAIVYFTAQAGKKRHPDTLKAQLKIIKNVPNSYLLIKGFSDQQILTDFVKKMAEQEGVDPEQLRFLPMTQYEAQHRANYTLADVILDTYPYTGATTTMEALWMGIPIVTCVGKQFVARNTYTMLKNAGISAGIAHSLEEYTEWGIRLGKDKELRQEVILQLYHSRQTSPLWQADDFTREVENAYFQMWKSMDH